MNIESSVPKRELSQNVDPHLKHREIKEAFCLEQSQKITTPLKSILTIELNITELCNRKCVFCPRVDPKIYPNQNLNMDITVIRKLVEEVAEIGIFPRFSFSGFGEPILHKQIVEFVNIIHSRLPRHTIEINTNGDRLNAPIIADLFAAGLTYLYVNLYDGPEQITHFEKLMQEADIDQDRYKFRPHYEGEQSEFGLTLNNRSGTVNSPSINLLPLNTKLDRRCNYPYYKLLLDWNGDVLFCSNDWGRNIIIGNFLQLSLPDIWLHPKFEEIRMRLLKGDRGFAPCEKCNVNGLITGTESVRVLVSHYLKNETILISDVPIDLQKQFQL